MKRLAMVACALLLGQGPALAQDEAVEEVPAEEAPADVVEEAPAEAPADAAVEDVAADEPAGEETAWEGQGSGFVDVYYLPTFDVDQAGVERGDGAGARGQFQFWKFLAVSGEYTTRTFDDVDADLNDQRLGLGVTTRNGSGDTAGLFVEFERLESETDEMDGLGVHGRMSHAASEWFRFYGDIGYKRLEDDVEKYTAFEFNAGVVFSYGPFGVFADWRRAQFEGKDSGDRFSIADVRAGARWAFGG